MEFRGLLSLNLASSKTFISLRHVYERSSADAVSTRQGGFYAAAAAARVNIIARGRIIVPAHFADTRLCLEILLRGRECATRVCVCVSECVCVCYRKIRYREREREREREVFMRGFWIRLGFFLVDEKLCGAVWTF